MTYQEIPPDLHLADFVKCYWWFNNKTTNDLEYTILPDGYFDLIISFENLEQKTVSLTGLWTKQVEVSIEPGTQLFGIRFKLLAVDYILAQSITSICNSELKLANDFWQLDKIPFSDLDKAIAVLNKKMLSILGCQKGIDSRKQTLFKLLYETKGQQRVESYSQQVFWTSRQINRYFRDRFGLSLKEYCNILKCFESFRHIKNGQFYPQLNYFDQSHFIKEVKKHSGSHLKDLYQNKNDRFLQLAAMTEK